MRTQDSANSTAATDKPKPVKRARVAVACQRNEGLVHWKKLQKELGSAGNANANGSGSGGGGGGDEAGSDSPPKNSMTVAFSSVNGIGDWWSSSSTAPTPTNAVAVRRHTKRPSVSFDVGDYAESRTDLNDFGGVESVVEILRDLSLEAGGGYIGASSHITMGRMIGSIVKAKETFTATNGRGIEEHLSPKSVCTAASPPDGILEARHVPADIAERLFKGYLKHISTRWPVLRTPYVRRLHAERLNLVDPYSTALLHLVYAIGGRFLETTGEAGNFFPEEHHAAALRHLDEILQYHEIRSVEVLLLFSIYSLRAPRGPGAWTYVGLAMRQCIDMGFHRRTPRKRRPLMETEMRKRLPLDVDEAVEDPALLKQAHRAAKIHGDQPPAKSSSMSCFIHICRLRIIESNIQQAIYRVDQPTSVTEPEAERFVLQLEQWKANMPRDARNPDTPSNVELDSMSMDGYDYHVYRWCTTTNACASSSIPASPGNKQTPSSSANAPKPAAACARPTKSCIRTSRPASTSWRCTVFLAGLTLIYCAWISPREVFGIVLYIITERWPGAKKYRDVFETIKQNALDSIEEGKYAPRRAIKKLRPTLRQTLRTIDKNEEGQEEFEAMVADMAGAETEASGEGSLSLGTSPNTERHDSHDFGNGDMEGGQFTFGPPLDNLPLDYHGGQLMQGISDDGEVVESGMTSALPARRCILWWLARNDRYLALVLSCVPAWMN
ncbi:uncharacterized protein BDZ99DRAFT_477985 [Mytilinidion resinicola]|uniref:Xylanolytic transcriptional activator regulatory domain-containing protein n=1 Tax=Mytilinidion resinicola TaxID=574789 RepID=A0A6A6YKJ7_9PEZI|nr:uncharacterized protein BDZ99DRAFT_477985 [Mytilinidion resinicola]KAF2808485.1 hypothetical protein BDZ99DRAFT_477985 [Mytilinidion resinicola]